VVVSCVRCLSAVAELDAEGKLCLGRNCRLPSVSNVNDRTATHTALFGI
jgi:hypothetical protein